MISSRENEVLQQISCGFTTKEIASNLHLSPHTVISHRQSLMIKLDARNTAGLVRRGFEEGFLRFDNTVRLVSKIPIHEVI